MKTCIIIPARMHSERFPFKLMAKFNGKSILENMMIIANETAALIKHESTVVLAISHNGLGILDIDILKMCEDYDIKPIVMHSNVETSCGTERARYVCKERVPGCDYYITIPADEPGLDPVEISKTIDSIISEPYGNIYTLYTRFYNKEDLFDDRSCKIVTGSGSKVLYTSRAVIPSTKGGVFPGLGWYKKHVGVFVFPRNVLEMRNIWKPKWNGDNYAKVEGLEQNTFIDREKFKFYAVKTKHIGFGIDTEDQIKELEDRLNKQ